MANTSSPPTPVASVSSSRTIHRRLPIGAEPIVGGGVHFRLWAPRREEVSVVFTSGQSIPLEREEDGYFSGLAPDARDGDLYQFRVDGERILLPDPASRYQPQGVQGPSQVVDPHLFKWTDDKWKGLSNHGIVLYEMHVGTFTRGGTWASARERLAELKELGITCLEVMPVAEFPGDYGWGYDGVDLFAPTRAYGTPDDFRAFVDYAHSIGLAVILDVVYNHIGPDGNYLKLFSDQYFTTKHSTDWGESLNFDDTGAAGVHEYFISNARHWIAEYHLDGFRFDATHAIVDESPSHVLTEITAAAREAAGDRSIYLISENESQETRIVRPPDAGGNGMDALWNDDFHHSAMVALSGRNEAYFTDYRGKPQEFISAAKWGYLFQGQFFKWQKKRRGTPALDLPASAFVNYIQNHDQVANYGHGQRVDELASRPQLRAMTAVLLLLPQTPMLFQGQEFAASTRFHYFVDHNPELAALVSKGRVKELAQFPSVATPEMVAVLPDPADRRTFEKCILNWDERDQGFHGQILRLHKDLLALRRNDPCFNRVSHRGDLDGAVLGPEAFALRFFHPDGDDRLLVVNLGTDLHLDIIPEPLLAAPLHMHWDTIFSTEDPAYGGSGSPPLETRSEDWRLPGENWRIPGRCAAVLRPIPLTRRDEREENRLQDQRRQECQTGLENEAGR